MLAQKNDEGKEHMVYYLSKILNDAKNRYKAGLGHEPARRPVMSQLAVQGLVT